MTNISVVANHFIKHVEDLAVEVVEGVIQRMDLKIPDWEKKQATQMYIEFMGYLGQELMNKTKGVPEELVAWSKRNGERGLQTEEEFQKSSCAILLLEAVFQSWSPG
jgi:rsbT co-antagonist protein RsbR